MMSDEATLRVIDALESFRVPYMLVGSLSTNYYGVARATQDADFVIQLGDISIAQVMENIGPELRLEPQMSFETITGTSKFVLTMPDNPFKVELFQLSDDPYDLERFSRRRRGTVAGRQTFILSAEDVVVTKLRWSRRGARTKDLDDARNVIAVQRDALDWDYIHRWCEQHGTRQLLDNIRASLPPL
jgi:hypothetical protein